MKELSLNILDIAKNSTRAGAKNIGIYLNEDECGILTIKISDDGYGMSEETVKAVSDPFYTSRTTRKVGLGIPFLKLAANQADGDVTIESKTEAEFPKGHGTSVTATFDTGHIDFTPLGDVTDSILTLIQGDPDINWIFEHNTPERKVRLSTAEIKEILGDGISLSEPEIICWLRDYVKEQYDS